MKPIIKLSVLLFAAFLMSCGGNSKKEAQGVKEQKDAVQEETHLTIKTQEEFNSYLAELGITVMEGLEFIEFKGEIPLGSMKDYPTNFTCIYKVAGENYFDNENSLMSYYKKQFTEILNPKGWTDDSLPGTGILNLHNKEGKFRTISIIVTPSDIAKNKGKQEFKITLWTR